MTGTGISIVIATRERPDFLEKALRELALGMRSDDEIIVVDSASRDERVSDVAAKANVRLVRLDEPGTSRARNAGWNASTSDIVAFIDDDCLVTPGWAESVQRILAEDGVGFVTGRVTGDRPAALSISLLTEEQARRFEGPQDPMVYGHGSNMAFRRTALEAVGGFDEGLGPGTPLRAAEDQDMFWRVARSGWQGAYEPAMEVTHRQWRSTTQVVRRQFAYGMGAGALAVKMLRMRDPLGSQVLRRRLWGGGLALSARSAVRGHKTAAIGVLVKFFGVMFGCLRASVIPIREGRFVPSRS